MVGPLRTQERAQKLVSTFSDNLGLKNILPCRLIEANSLNGNGTEERLSRSEYDDGDRAQERAAAWSEITTHVFCVFVCVYVWFSQHGVSCPELSFLQNAAVGGSCFQTVTVLPTRTRSSTNLYAVFSTLSSCCYPERPTERSTA